MRAYLIALVIAAAALGVRTAWAENAAHQGSESTTAHPAAASGTKEKTVPAKAKAGAPAAQNKPGAEVKPGSPEKAASTPEIDTRIGVPEGKVRKSPMAPDKKPLGSTPPWMKAHELRPAGPVDHPVRNAIGIASPIHPPGGGMAPGQPHSQPPIPIHPIAPLTASDHPVVAAAPHNIAVPVAHLPPPPNTAAISGTGVARPGVGPGIIGGAAKKVTGINGTSIRPRY